MVTDLFILPHLFFLPPTLILLILLSIVNHHLPRFIELEKSLEPITPKVKVNGASAATALVAAGLSKPRHHKATANAQAGAVPTRIGHGCALVHQIWLGAFSSCSSIAQPVAHVQCNRVHKIAKLQLVLWALVCIRCLAGDSMEYPSEATVCTAQERRGHRSNS